MPGNSFADTNLFIYAVDSEDAAKQKRAEMLLRELRDTGTGVVSYQVLQEFMNTVLRGSLRLSSDEIILSAF